VLFQLVQVDNLAHDVAENGGAPLEVGDNVFRFELAMIPPSKGPLELLPAQRVEVGVCACTAPYSTTF